MHGARAFLVRVYRRVGGFTVGTCISFFLLLAALLFDARSEYTWVTGHKGVKHWRGCVDALTIVLYHGDMIGILITHMITKHSEE